MRRTRPGPTASRSERHRLQWGTQGARLGFRPHSLVVSRSCSALVVESQKVESVPQTKTLKQSLFTASARYSSLQKYNFQVDLFCWSLNKVSFRTFISPHFSCSVREQPRWTCPGPVVTDNPWSTHTYRAAGVSDAIKSSASGADPEFSSRCPRLMLSGSLTLGAKLNFYTLFPEAAKKTRPGSKAPQDAGAPYNRHNTNNGVFTQHAKQDQRIAWKSFASVWCVNWVLLQFYCVAPCYPKL